MGDLGEMSTKHHEQDFTEFVRARQKNLQRLAWLLTGDWGLAEDLVQTALAKTWPHWMRVVQRDNPDLYVRKVVLNTYLTWRRRLWGGEQPTAVMPDTLEQRDEQPDLRVSVAASLARLPARQRAVVVLLFFEDLSEAGASAALGCSVGTIKSQKHKALQRLRTDPGIAALMRAEVE